MSKTLIILAAIGLCGIAFTLTAVAWVGRQAARWVGAAWVWAFTRSVRPQ